MKSLKDCVLLASGLMIVLSTTSLAAESKVSDVVDSAKTAVFDLLDKDSLTVSFRPDSAIVSESEKKTLQALVNSFRNNKTIKRVIIAAWSDNDLPVSDKVKLSFASKKLANERAENLKKVLSEMKVTNIETHSMAQHANWVQKFFRTNDAEIKESMKKDNDQASVQDAALTNKLASKGGAGKAVVIMMRDKSIRSH